MFNEIPEGLFEALIFSSDQPLSRKRILEILKEGGIALEECESAFDTFIESYNRRSDSGVEIVEVGSGYQMCTRADLHDWILRLRTVKEKIRLSRAAMETLAIVAYKQPVITPIIDNIRGVKSGPVLRTLLEKGLIRVLGRMNVPGKPLMYGTTQDFLLQFGLKDLSSLPTLAELKDFGEMAETPGPAIGGDYDTSATASSE